MNVLLLALFISASSAFAASPIKIQELSQDPEWIRLGHYQQTLFGRFTSSVRGNQFFLHPQGSTNPEAELQTTYQKMFEESDAVQIKTQCEYLARRDFIQRKLQIPAEKIKPCLFSEDWLKRLSPSRVTVVFASSYLNSAASSFGHTFLKLQDLKNQGGNELLDYGVNFAARTDDKTGALYALYGLFGFFPGSFGMLPYHQMIKEYTNLEGRDLWEYELNFTEQETKRLVFHLLELEKAYFDYYFIDDNCSFQLQKLLEVARPGLSLASGDEGFVIPLETIKDLKKVTGLVSKVTYRPSLMTEWQQRKESLSSEEKNQLSDLFQTKIFPSQISANVLSAAQLLADLKGENDFRYEISKKRAQVKASDDFVRKTPQEAPDQGLDSAMLAVGAYELEDQSGAFLRGRMAFHDFLSSDVGASPRSQLEIFSFDLRTRADQKYFLKKATFLRILSTEAVDQYFRNPSWGIDLSADRVTEKSTLQSQAKGNYGYRFDFANEKITTLFFGAMAAKQNQNSQFKFMSGFELQTVFNWTSRIRSSLSGEQMFGTYSEEFKRLNFEQVFDLGQQLELRGFYANHFSQNHTTVDMGVGLHGYFLF